MEEKTIKKDNSLDENKKNKRKKIPKFSAKCFHCKKKDEVETENGMKYKLSYSTVGIKKDKNLLKECKKIIKENKNKYKDLKVLKRLIYNGCPICGKSITITAKDYVDFYSDKKE